MERVGWAVGDVQPSVARQIEAAVVPVAGDHAVANQTPHQRKHHVRALVVEGVVAAIRKEQRESPFGAATASASPSAKSPHLAARIQLSPSIAYSHLTLGYD